VTRASGVIDVCAYTTGGEAVAFGFVEARRGFERKASSASAVFLSLSDVADLLASHGDTALADAAYAQRVAMGLVPTPDEARVAIGADVLTILAARLSTAAASQGLPAVVSDVVVYDGPLGLLDDDAPVAAARTD